MSYEILPTRRFQKDVKTLAKKYRKIKQDLMVLQALLKNNPEQADAIPGLKEKIYKIRLQNSDLVSGKRGGYRIVYFLDREEKVVHLLSMYVKGEKETIRKKELLQLMKQENLLPL